MDPRGLSHQTRPLQVCPCEHGLSVPVLALQGGGHRPSMNDDRTAADLEKANRQRTVRITKMIEHTIILIRIVSTVESSMSASRRPEHVSPGTQTPLAWAGPYRYGATASSPLVLLLRDRLPQVGANRSRGEETAPAHDLTPGVDVPGTAWRGRRGSPGPAYLYLPPTERHGWRPAAVELSPTTWPRSLMPVGNTEGATQGAQVLHTLTCLP